MSEENSSPSSGKRVKCFSCNRWVLEENTIKLNFFGSLEPVCPSCATEHRLADTRAADDKQMYEDMYEQEENGGPTESTDTGGETGPLESQEDSESEGSIVQ